WDATDEAGNRVPDGEYRHSVTATDRAGNTTRVETTALRVDTRPTPLFVTAEYGAFAPNEDGFRDSITITSYVGLPEGIESWEMELVHESGQVVLRRAGDMLGPVDEWQWDGRGAEGEILEGEYSARVSVEYEKGNRPSTVSDTFLLDISPPRVGVELDPLPFSPDDDGVDDELFISIEIENRSDIAFWSFEILDRNDRFFHEFSGRGRPSDTITWDGRSETGQLVISAEDYPYVLTVTDVLGKTTVVEGEIPIDILVIRDGDRLRVQIANITFAPNSPELIIEPVDERGARNLAIMNRLAEIFTRYSMYSIQIEGHAVNLSETEREEREELQPLSLARAESVKEAMVQRGIASRRITAVGRGGTEPIVPHSDLDERWKNRRVEFILIR
ncbi:MAG: OmpA family protein, partial [Spirochaetia bacterium]